MKKMKLAITLSALAPISVFAEEVAATAGGTHWAVYLSAALCMALAAAVVGYSQSRAASAALEGIARNPASAKPIFVPLILSLALMESLVLFAFVIANTIAGK